MITIAFYGFDIVRGRKVQLPAAGLSEGVRSRDCFIATRFRPLVEM